MIENADIWLNRVFVPDENRLEKAQDFQSGTNRILESSRVGVAWGIAGGAAGAYEAALRYALNRKQFGKPIAKFQLIQEKLTRMLSIVEMMLSNLILLSLSM
jgi:alkylation response protein AidB-like acyl-CoA dehydrogenase